MSYHHSPHQPQHSSIKTLTHPVPATQNATPFGHTRILSRFFLPPPSCGATGATGLMQFKITKTSTAVRRTEGANNKHKTIPRSLYDDPAFSADPSSNPLCSASHDITSWVIDPPKGHPAIKSPQTHRSSHSNHEITLIQPPNSPALLHAHPQQQPQVRTPAVSPPLDPPPSSLSPGTSSAPEPYLQTPGASRSSPIKSYPDIPSMLSSRDNKKRLGLSFLKRKVNAEGAAMNRLKSNKSISSGENPKNMEFISHSHSLVNGSGAAMNGTTNGKMPGVVKGQFAPVKTRELDMIDELDETNPLGIALHHGGPYEAIQRVVGAHAYAPRAPRKPNHQPPPVQDQPFRFDVPLNLSPGQVLPHSVTCYYRPRVHLAPASDIRDRLSLDVPPFRDHPTDHPAEQIPLASAPAVNRKAGTVMSHPNIDYSATGLTSSLASYPITSAPPPYVALESPHQHEIPEQIQPVSRVRAPDPPPTSQHEHQVLPPSDQVDQSAMESPGTEGTHEADEEPGEKMRITEHAVAAERQMLPDNQGAVQQFIPNRADYSTLPYLTGTDRETLTPPYGLSRRNTPSPHPNHVPSAPHDPYGRQELPQAPVYDRRLYGIKSSAPNSNSSLHSGASSTGSGSTAGTSATLMPTRSRLLPKQLIMPAPLAKAAVSSRPKPTQMPQSLQQWQDVRGQHRIRFHDGTEYELPVTALNLTTGRERPASMQVLPANTIKPHIRVNSIAHGAKLRKQTSLRGPEPAEIVARLAAAPRVVQRRKYMEPPPTLPDPPRVDKGVTKEQGKDAKRFLTKRKSLL